MSAAMKILISIPLHPYNALRSRCEISSLEYHILMNGIIVHGLDGQRRIEILCDLARAQMMLDFANRVYPEIAGHIEDSIQLARAA